MSDPDRRVSRRSLIRTTGAGLGGALLAGCTGGGGGDGGDGGGGGGGGNGDGSSGGGGGVDSLTIGLLSPESGAYGFLGKAYTRATELRIEEVKESSEVLADTEINVVKGDTQSDPDTALEVARELTLQKGADILNGTANSQSAGTVAQFAGQEGIPFLAGMTATQEITHGKNCQWTVARLTPSTYAGPNILGTFGPEELGESGYVLYPDYTTGYQHRDLVPKAIEAAGGEVLKVTAAPLGNQDYAGIIDEIKSLGPDFIFCGMMGSGALPFYKQCAARGVTAPIMGNLIISQMSYGLSLDELDKLGDLYRFARYTREIPTDANKQFVQTYKDEFDAVPTFPDGFAYQTANLMFNAIEGAGSKDPDAVMTEIEGMRWDDLSGENFIRECDHQGAPKVYVARITGHDDEFEMGTQEIVKQYDMQDFYPACEDVPCDMASKRPS